MTISGLTYQGPVAVAPRDVIHLLAAEDIFSGGMSRSYVTGRAHDLALLKGTRVYVDQHDNLYQAVGYSTTANNALVPNGARGTAGGVASLGSLDTKVPVGQVPIMGASLLHGPYGPENAVTTTVSTDSTPIKLFDFYTGHVGVNGFPWPFMDIMAKSIYGRTVIEVRVGTSGENDYADQVLLARGVGESFYYDWQPIEVWSVTPELSMGQDGIQHAYEANDSVNIDVWMYDEEGGTSSTQAGYTVSASLYFAITSL